MALISALFTPLNITVIIFICMVTSFICGTPRADLAAVCGLLALTLTGILTPAEALSGFSNPVTFMIIGVFVVSSAIFRTGLAKMLGSRLLRLAGSGETKIFVVVMLSAAFMGAFMSSTGVVAMMLPIVISMTSSINQSPKRYLMPLAFASAMGFFTLISSTSNLVVQNSIVASGLTPLGFFSFAPVGFICLGIGMVALFFMSNILVSKDKTGKKKKADLSLSEVEKKYYLGNSSFLLSVNSTSPVINKTLTELMVGKIYGININKVSRKTGKLPFSKNRLELMAGPNTKLRKDDILSCQGNCENVKRFAKDNHLDVMEGSCEAFSDFHNFGIAELYIMPSSKLVNRTISDIKFRETYRVNILGLQRQNIHITDNIGDTKLRKGDLLLVQGAWSTLINLNEEHNEIVLVGQPLKEAERVTLDSKAPIAAVITILMIVCMVFNIVPPVIALLAAAALMALTGCLRNMREAYDGIKWQSVALVAAMIPMSIAFQKTHITEFLSGILASLFGESSRYAMLAGIYVCTSVLTMFVINTATAILLAPIAMQAAISVGSSPYPFLMAVAVSACMCFASPFATSANAIVMTVGRYSFMDFIKVGLPLQIVIGVVMILTLPLIYPF